MIDPLGGSTDSAMDPILMLNDELMVVVFSFVGGRTAKSKPERAAALTTRPDKKEADEAVEYVEVEVTEEEEEKLKNQKKADMEEDQFLDVMEAGRFYFSLARVSKGWKKIIDGVISHFATNIIVKVDLSYDGGRSCWTWLGAHKLSIGCYVGIGKVDGIGNATTPDEPPLLTMLRECETISTIDLSLIVYDYYVAGSHLHTCRQYLDEVAQQCPNIRRASLLVYLRDFGLNSSVETLISPSFFSLSALNTLVLTLNVHPSQHLHTMAITKMVEGLPNLEYLFLDSHGCATMGRDMEDRVFPIRSNSLKQLLVENFTKQVQLSLDCPKLEVYRCKGFMAHAPQMGHLPQRIALQQRVVGADTVPESCLALVIHVCNPNGLPLGFPFSRLLGPNVSLLPLQSGHGTR